MGIDLRALYKYTARIVRVIDADTIDVDVDLGFRIRSRQRLRLIDINAPEPRGSERREGLIAKRFVRSLLPVGSLVEVHSKKEDSFGRWISVVWFDTLLNEDCDVDLSEYLVTKGYAKYEDY